MVRGTCTCGYRWCEHYAFAKDVVSGGGGVAYVLKSALHKEIRRGDIARARITSRWLAHILNPSTVKGYCAKVLLEETRNAALYLALSSLRGKETEDVVVKVVSSRKKQDIVARRGSFLDYCAGYAAACSTKARFGPKDAKSDNPVDLFTAFWALRLAGTFQESSFRAALIERAVECGGWPKAVAEGKLYGLYAHKMLIEMLVGRWDESANEHAPVPPFEDDSDVIVMPDDYVYDNHTRIGRRRLADAFHKIAPGHPQPPGIDLRWSGLLLGVVWREFAAIQFPYPAYVSTPWEAVKIPDDAWEAASRLDRHFYKRFYGAMDAQRQPRLF